MLPDLARHCAHLAADPLAGAFSARRAVMPFRGKNRVETEAVPALWAEAMARTDAPSPRIAYVHIPFCANHCLFCGFYRNAHVPETAASYVDQVIRDIEAESSLPGAQAAPIEALYLGGGTPSALTAAELSRLLEALRRFLPLAPDCEITVEGRIIHFDDEKVAACLEAGANRFSIGVQSFDTSVRRRQGRRASREDAIAFIEGLNAHRGAAIVIDLMYGLPGQTAEVWQRDLETAAALEPDGIDLYGLNLIPGTPLHQAMQAGKFAQAPGLSDLGGYYRTGSTFMTGQGWRQVSNNHWARTALERNRYNRLIKEGADCLAYGSGAGGSLGDLGYGLTGNLEEFAAAVRDGRKPIGMMSAADGLRGLRNFIVGSLECGRLEFAGLDRLAGHGLSVEFRPLFEQWAAAGLLVLSDDGFDLGLAGRFWYATINAALHDLVEARLLPRTEAA